MSSHAPLAAPPGLDKAPLWFTETLPAAGTDESLAEAEARVLLDLETDSPIPVDRLAYGWVRLPSREILYYAAPRDRIAEADEFAPVGTIVPSADELLLPPRVAAEDFRRAARHHFSDIRDRETIDRLRRNASADKLLARVSLPLKLGAAAGLLLVVAAAGLNLRSTLTEKSLAAQAEKSREIRMKADLLAQLDRLENANHSVFDAVAIVNAHRPDGVVFNRITLEQGTDLTLEGRAPDIAAVTRFKEALLASGHFAASGAEKLDAAAGRASFRLRFSLKSWPKIADEPAKPADEPAKPATA